MKVSAIRLATGLAVALAFVLVCAAPALAESRGFPCGKVTAYTPPTATTPGSIRIGTTTFATTAGSLPNPPPPIAVGSILCLTGRLDATGAFTSLTTATLGEQVVCGTVQAFAPASTTTPGSVTILSNASWTLPVRAGVALSAAQATGAQCFKFGVNADGNAEVVGYSGPGTPAPVGQLPNTSTRDSSEGALAILALAGTLLVALRVFAIRRATGRRP